jgi:hypothetical protein
MPKGWTDDDPGKGKPYRRVHEQIGLLLDGIGDHGLSLRTVLLKIAETRPLEVLDALVWLCRDDDVPLVLDPEANKSTGQQAPSVLRSPVMNVTEGS